MGNALDPLMKLFRFCTIAIVAGGCGITSYGALYFIAHDGLVHQRWPFRYVPKSGYLKRLYQAHRLHHAVKGKEGCVSFGFLWAPSVESLKSKLKRNSTRYSLAFYEDGAEGRE